MIDLTSLRLRRIGPIGKRLLADPAKDFIELSLADEEGIVLRGDLAVGIHEIDVDAVGGRDHEERPPPLRSRQAQDFSQKRRRCFAVSGPYNGVIEINRHLTARAGIPARANSRSGQSFQSDVVGSFHRNLIAWAPQVSKTPI